MKYPNINEETKTKLCKFCSTWKPFSEFCRHKGMPLQLNNRCKSCMHSIQKTYLEAHKQERSEYHAAWYIQNARAEVERVNRWNLQNPEKRIEYENRRRALKAQTSIEKIDWKSILKLYNYACAYCGKPGKMTMDHVVPLSRGGTHTASNVVPACRSCNCRKHDRLLSELSWELRKVV